MSLRTRWMPESANRPFLQGFRDVRLGRFQRIERSAIIFHVDSDLSGLRSKADFNFVFSFVRITIENDVGENFFHGEGFLDRV